MGKNGRLAALGLVVLIASIGADAQIVGPGPAPVPTVPVVPVVPTVIIPQPVTPQPLPPVYTPTPVITAPTVVVTPPPPAAAAEVPHAHVAECNENSPSPPKVCRYDSDGVYRCYCP